MPAADGYPDLEPRKGAPLSGGESRSLPRVHRRYCQRKRYQSANGTCLETLQLRRVCSLEFRAGGMVSLSVGAWLPSAAPDEARASGHGAGNSCLALSAGGRRGGARR